MFSEYASRFLAQSQSRIVPHPDEKRRKDHGRLIQHPGSSRYPSRSFLQRKPVDPYHPGTSQISNLAFGSRNLAQQAPLFYSATDDFQEEDDEAEHEREIADFYALQRSRRHFGSSHLKDSETSEDDNNTPGTNEQYPNGDRSQINGGGLKATWRASKFGHGGRNWFIDPVTEVGEGENKPHETPEESRARGKLVDVRLEDTLRSDVDDEGGGSRGAGDDKPPSIQRFRETPQSRMGNFGGDSFFTTQEVNKQAPLDDLRPPTAGESDHASIDLDRTESLLYDAFWGQLFLISLACLFATSFLIYLHTSPPSGGKSKLGDTIYLTVHGSFYLLGVYTMVSIFISLLWLALLRSYVRPLVYVITFAVPVILYSFSLYPFISSFQGKWGGSSRQDKVMRFVSIIPFVMATAWIYNVIRGRRAIGRAIGILEFACRILAANPELLAVGLGNLVVVVSWTWAWVLMFTRVFLGGHLSESKLFIISPSSWWLGVYFIFVYVWSLGIIAGIQRAATAATVSQWYFHRLASPAPTSRQIVQAATVHSLTTLFGTICLSRLIALLIRIPLLLLPSRITSILSLFAYGLVPAPAAALTDPLSLTYAAIHSQPLASSARGLTQMTNLAPSIATSSLHPQSFSRSRGSHAPLLSYRLSKLILHAARLMMSLALGFGGWVSTARSLGVPGLTRGSMYAYIVGLIAGTIGWSVLGSIEGVIADIVDASIICWSSEVGTYGREARYCREAGWLFGQELNSSDTRRPVEV